MLIPLGVRGVLIDSVAALVPRAGSKAKMGDSHVEAAGPADGCARVMARWAFHRAPRRSSSTSSATRSEVMFESPDDNGRKAFYASVHGRAASRALK